MERYIAVDNGCLWPNLSVLADGKIGVTGFDNPSHGFSPGDVRAWVSQDGGRTWGTQGVPVPRVEGQIRMNHAAGVTPDGRWLCAVAGYGKWKRSPSAVANVQDYVLSYEDYWNTLSNLDPLVAASSDLGSTWTPLGELPALEGHALIPFGKIQCGGDGLLRMSAYSIKKGGKRESGEWRAHFLRSCDNGASWEIQFSFPVLGATEVATLYLGSRWWFAALRRTDSSGGDVLMGYFSDDDGGTWSGGEILGVRGSIPASLVLWQERLLLLYGNRAEHNSGVDVRVYDSTQRGWSTPRRLANLRGDIGYPSAVVNAQNDLVVGYYASSAPYHNRYHLGVLILSSEEFGLSNFPKFELLK